MSARVRVVGPKPRNSKPAYKVPLFVYENIFNDAYEAILNSKNLGSAVLPGFRVTNTEFGLGIIQSDEGVSVSGDLVSISPGVRRRLDNSVSREYHRRLVTLEDGSDAYTYIYEPNQIYLDKSSRHNKLRELLKFSDESDGLEDVSSGKVVLSPGDSGMLVRKVQQILIDKGYILPCYGIDGRLGPETKKAIEVFQKSRQDIPSNTYGTVDSKTLEALTSMTGNPAEEDISELQEFNKTYCTDERNYSETARQRDIDLDKFSDEAEISVRSFSSSNNLPIDGVFSFIAEVSDDDDYDEDVANEVLQELGLLYDEYGDWAEAIVAYKWGSVLFDNWLESDRKRIFDVPRRVRRFSSKMGQVFGTGDIFTDRYREAIGSDLILVAPMDEISVTSPFGRRRRVRVRSGKHSSSNHMGVDIRAPVGANVYSAHNGIVTKTVRDHGNSGGNYIKIKSVNKEFVTLYMHLDQIIVYENQEVSSGEVIGLSGETGAVSGPHLHFELKIGGIHVNPMLYIGREVVALSNNDKKKLFKIASEYGPIEEQDVGFEDLLSILSEDGGQLIYLDNPKGSFKNFGDDLVEMTFDYGEFPEFINPADDMGWDIIIVPSESGKLKDEEGAALTVISGDQHSLTPVGLVPVNTNADEWARNTISKKYPNGKKPPTGNDKIILAPDGKYEDKDVSDINKFFKGLWQFKDVIWY